MLYGIVAKPGEGKSYFAVTKIYGFQQTNIQNIKTNIPIYYENKRILEDRGVLDKDFTFKYDIGNKEFIKTTNYSYYEQFEDEEQFEQYFEYFFFYNKYIEQIESELQIKLARLLPVHQIYSNINGLKISGVLPMPIDLDWRRTPWGSIHFIDEIRDFYPYNNKDGRKISTSGMILEMSKVRHTDKDVWLITQDAEDYNYSLRQLFDKLYFVKRPPSKMQACAVYVFDQYLSRPRAAADSTRDPKKYVDYFLVVYKKKYQRMYVSASSHTSMIKKINIKVFGYIFLFLLFATITVVGLMKIPIFEYFGTATKMMAGASKDDPLSLKSAAQNSSTQTVSSSTPTMADQLKIEQDIKNCVDTMNMTLAQCTDLYDIKARELRNAELAKTTQNENEKIVARYKVSDPFNYEYLEQQEQNANMRVFSGCLNNVAYDNQGSIIHDAPQNLCKRLYAGDRPYSPVKQVQPQQIQQQTPSL